jgi:hypothetical protein
MVWAIHGGKDLNWDQANYHVYGPHSLVHERFAQDFMAASVQGYLNPVAHLPFYAMIMANWHSVAIAATLAFVHGLALALIYFIARTEPFFPGGRGRGAAVACTLLASATVTFWSAVGGSYVDISTVLPVLAAVWLYADGTLRKRPYWEALSLGLLLGLAAALKLTNGIYVIAGAVWPIGNARDIRAGSRALATFAAGVSVGALVGGGYWSWRLWRELGNPVFPMFNGIFRSPDFPAVNLYQGRYLPQSLQEALLAPVRMVLPDYLVYTELVSPDLRVLLLICALAAFAVRAAISAEPSRVSDLVPRPFSALSGLLLFYAIAFALWLATSFNARYAMGLLLLTGLLLAAVLRALLPRRAFMLAVLLALAMQLLTILNVSPTRANISEPYAWTKQWFEFQVPKRLRDEPHLFLGAETQTNSFLAAFVHPGSGFINLHGQVALDLDGPGGDRVRHLLDRYAGRIVLLGRYALESGAHAPTGDWVVVNNSILERFGLQLDLLDCSQLESWNTFDAWAEAANRLVGLASLSPRKVLMTCGVKRAPPDEAFRSGRPRVDAIFNALERACPRAFTPGLARTERIGSTWLRSYMTTDRGLVLDGSELYAEMYLFKTRTKLGVARDWESGRLPACPL